MLCPICNYPVINTGDKGSVNALYPYYCVYCDKRYERNFVEVHNRKKSMVSKQFIEKYFG